MSDELVLACGMSNIQDVAESQVINTLSMKSGSHQTHPKMKETNRLYTMTILLINIYKM